MCRALSLSLSTPPDCLSSSTSISCFWLFFFFLFSDSIISLMFASKALNYRRSWKISVVVGARKANATRSSIRGTENAVYGLARNPGGAWWPRER